MPAKVQARHTLSYQLREIIDSRGLTPYAVGQLAEVDPGVISRWINGRRDIRLETADKVALALGVRLNEMPGSRGAVGHASRGRLPVRPARARAPVPVGTVEASRGVEAEGCQLAEAPTITGDDGPGDPGPGDGDGRPPATQANACQLAGPELATDQGSVASNSPEVQPWQ